MRARDAGTRIWALLIVGTGANLTSLLGGGLAFGINEMAWALPWLTAFVAGAVAVLMRPDLLPARRLLLLGVIGGVWNAANHLLIDAYQDLGQTSWMAVANLAHVSLGLALPAAILALAAVYPDGRYQRPPERALVRAAFASTVLVPLVYMLASPTQINAWAFEWMNETGSGELAQPSFESPLHVGFLDGLGGPIDGFYQAALAVIPLTAAIVLGLRFRRFRSEDDRRLQIRWPAYGSLAIAIIPAEQLLYGAGAISLGLSAGLDIAVLVLLPISLAIGLVRPDLFDLDRAVRRTLIYVPLWAAIAGLYVGGAALLGVTAGGDSIQVAVAVTIVASVLFEPIRRRLVARLTQRMYGESVSGEELLRRLGSTLESTLDLDELAASIAATAREGLRAEWVVLDIDGAAPARAGTLHPGAQPSLEAPLCHAGEQLGRIACGPRMRGPMEREDHELFETLAAQAALAVHNARLAGELGERLGELREQADELSASRARLVAAEEDARRRIERDLHDGAQQELAALIARIGLARNQLGRDPSSAAETLGELQGEAIQALASLRELASGIHPSVLEDRGLVEALEVRAGAMPLGVTIECDPGLRDQRFAPSLEGAIYFFCGEGFANALKHSGAARVRLRLERRGNDLEVEVADDGDGFDVARAETRGLSGLRDRIGALGGEVHVISMPGEGTRLRARLPAPERAVV